MTLKRIPSLSSLLYVTALIFVTSVIAQQEVTTTLLPIEAKSDPASPNKLLKISADNSTPIKSTSSVSLTFDLSGIPEGATIKTTKLRMVGKEVADNPQLVNVYIGDLGTSLGTWTAQPGKKVFSTATGKISGAIKGKQQAIFTLKSFSRLSNWDYYSLNTNPSSYQPRLIIQYQLPGAVGGPVGFNSPTRTSWKFFGTPADAKQKQWFTDGTIKSNPTFYDRSVYFFGAPNSGGTYLYAFSSWGVKRWDKKTEAEPGSYALTTDTGRLYSLGNGRIVLYDLDKGGEKILPIAENKDLNFAFPPTIGADGSLYFVPSGYGALHGLDPKQKELWRYPDEGKGSAALSEITLSPEAQQYAYVVALEKTQATLVRIDTADGSPETATVGDNFTGIHRPIVRKGSQNDYVVVSAYGDNSGILKTFSNMQTAWEKSGPASEPILDSTGDSVFVVQGGQLRKYAILNGHEECKSPATNLATTSNLVLDGEDNIYFWNNGTLFVYRKDCQPFLKKPLAGLAKNLQLVFTPDGVLYAINRTTHSLYTIMLTQSALTIKPADIRANTIYTAASISTEKDLVVDKRLPMIFRAENKIDLGPGFAVRNGASLRCQVTSPQY